MKLEGEIKLQTTPGRKDVWVKKQLENDYFLSLEITKINGKPISTCESAFQSLKDLLPAVAAGDQERLNDLFTPVTLPPNAKDVLHLTLANFGDFRIDRDVANDIDKEKVVSAEDINGQKVELELPENAFELVSTSEHHEKLQFGSSKITHAPSVGFKRDTIINLLPTEEGQKQLGKITRDVFGEDFVLWNARKQPVPYHVSIAQTNELNAKLVSKFANKVVENQENNSVNASAGV